jgi:hypothetical protein
VSAEKSLRTCFAIVIFANISLRERSLLVCIALLFSEIGGKDRAFI